MEANVLYEYIVEGHSQEKVGQRYGISQAEVSEIVRSNGLNKQASGSYQSGYHRGFYKKYKHFVTVEFIQRFLRSNYTDFEVYFADALKELKKREQQQQQIRQQQVQAQRQREQQERERAHKNELRAQQERERKNALLEQQRKQQLAREAEIQKQQLAREQALKRQEEERKRQQLAREQERKRQEQERLRQEEENRRQQLAREQQRQRLIAEKQHLKWLEEGRRLFQEKNYEQSLQYANKSHQLLPVLGNVELLVRLKLVYKHYEEAFTLVNNLLLHNPVHHNKHWVRLRARANRTDFALFNKDIQFLIDENHMTNNLYARFVQWSAFTNAATNQYLVDAYKYCLEKNYQKVNSTVGLAYVASIKADWKTFFHYINELVSLYVSTPQLIRDHAEHIFRLLHIVASNHQIGTHTNVVKLRVIVNGGKDRALWKQDMEQLMEQGESFDYFATCYIELANVNCSPDWFYLKQIYLQKLELEQNKLSVYKSLLECLYKAEQYEEYAKYADEYAEWFMENIEIHKYKKSEFYSSHSDNWINAICYAHAGRGEQVVTALLAMTSLGYWEGASVEQVSLLKQAIYATEQMENEAELEQVKQLLNNVEEFRGGNMRATQFYGQLNNRSQSDYTLKYDAAQKSFIREPLLKDKIKNSFNETFHNLMYYLKR